MWDGQWTDELSRLYDQYEAQHDGAEPDDYAEILYSAMSYDEFDRIYQGMPADGEIYPGRSGVTQPDKGASERDAAAGAFLYPKLRGVHAAQR